MTFSPPHERIFFDLIRENALGLGFVFFPDSGRDLDVYLFGIPSENLIPGDFDDTIGAAWLEDGCKRCFACRGTVHAGRPTYTDPKNPKGAPVWPIGMQQRGIFVPGLHRGRPALRQRIGTKIKLYRDNNRNNLIECSGPLHEDDYNGTHLHTPYRDGLLTVGAASEGCLVPYKQADGKFIVDLVKRQDEAGCGKTASYAMHLPELRTLGRTLGSGQL